jgi:arylsulfatase A-like enzyme/Flp pilus assembly protein TadD
MRIRLLVAVVIFISAACGGREGVSAPSNETPVFIISIDTLRSDRLPAYGYKGVETPHLDELRRDAILFQHAYSHTPLTFPSHASILTGLLPADHGVRDNIGFTLGPKVPTLQEALKSNGYATAAAVSSFVLRRETGMNRGFDHYDDEVEALSGRVRMLGNIQRNGSDTVAAAKEWLGKQSKTPFLLLHLYEPHTPYTPPEPYRSRFQDAYDGEIAYTDALVGDFLKFLRERGLYDRSLVIVLSDHGEGLGDHGEAEHGMFLYRQTIQVPLIVKLPEQELAGETVEEPVQLIDVVPTVLERTGAAMAAKLPGRSLLDFATGKAGDRRHIYSETYYPRFHFGWADQHSVIDATHHYIHSPKPQLFNVAADFEETKNILSEERRTTFAMRASVMPLIKEPQAPSAVDPEEAAKLAALGYLGASVQTEPGEELPDPKDHVQTFKDIGIAFIDYREKRYEKALATIDRLLRENSRIVDLYDLKGKVLTRLGRTEEAIEAGQSGLRIAPNSSFLAIDVANLLLEVKRFDEAAQHAELAMKADPGQVHDILARIAIEQKDLARAEKEARLAVEKDRDRVASLMTLARVEREQGKLESALAHLDEALQRKKPENEVVLLHFLRGDVLARMGRVEEAERELRREIGLFPEEPTAYKNLVLLLVAAGRTDEATRLIRSLIEESPTPPSYIAVCHVLETLGDTRGVRYWARQGLQKYPGHPVLRRLAA